MRQDRLLRTGARFTVCVPGLHSPVWLRAGTSDRQVFEEIIVGDELGFDFGKKPATILDLGANIGLSSVYLANRFPDARILALEVDAGNVELLRLNTRSYPGITVVPKAIWHRDGHVRIANPADTPWAFTVVEARDNEPGAVAAVAIATLLAEHGWRQVDFIKMDIEGTERELFEHGARDWLSRVSVLAVELHDRLKEGCTRTMREAIQTLPHHLVTRPHYTVAIFADHAAGPGISEARTSGKTHRPDR